MFDNEVVKTLEKHKDINDISTELLPRYMGRIICWHNNLYHRDIGTPKSYEKGFVRMANDFETVSQKCEELGGFFLFRLYQKIKKFNR